MEVLNVIYDVKVSNLINKQEIILLNIKYIRLSYLLKTNQLVLSEVIVLLNNR